jgi:hypothetical protein
MSTHRSHGHSLGSTRTVSAALLVLGQAALCAAALGACRPEPAAVANGDDPLAALRVSAQTTRYTDQWWRVQADSNPSLYRQAVDYCKTPGIVADGPKPNCGFVQLAANKLQVDSIARRGMRTEDAAKQIERSVFTP